MYTNQHTPWVPLALLVGEDPSAVDDLCLAALLSSSREASFDYDTLMEMRHTVCCAIDEMMWSPPSSHL